MSERTHILMTAGFWFKAARKRQSEGNMAEAMLCMENAYNHTENALAAILKKCPDARNVIESAMSKTN